MRVKDGSVFRLMLTCAKSTHNQQQNSGQEIPPCV